MKAAGSALGHCVDACRDKACDEVSDSTELSRAAHIRSCAKDIAVPCNVRSALLNLRLNDL